MYDDSSFNAGAESFSRSLSSCIAKVYGWMCFALVISGLTAYMVGTSEQLVRLFLGSRAMFIVLVLIEFGLVFGITAGIRKMSASTATALFILYAAVNGLTLSAIFVVFTLPAIAVTFGITAGTFGIMALIGTITRKDLTSLGNLLFMALIGLLIASIVNIFWANDTLYWIVTYAGVLIFVGLTAYDAQKVKNMYLQIGTENPEAAGKVAVLGALTLYLDFINLFLYLLRIFGGRRD